MPTRTIAYLRVSTEKQDLQRWLLAAPEALGESLFILSEEFGNWEDSKRRIDLLALDEDANLVVIELKRTDDGGHMDLQAIRYAVRLRQKDAHARQEARQTRERTPRSPVPPIKPTVHLTRCSRPGARGPSRTAGVAACVNHSLPFSPQESSKSGAFGPPKATGAWPLASQTGCEQAENLTGKAGCTASARISGRKQPSPAPQR
jgi:hypothetical protein